MPTRISPSAGAFVRRRTAKVLCVLAAVVWGIPHLVAAAPASAAPALAGTTHIAGSDSWPLAFSRVVHRTQLRANGATVTVLPHHRLQQAPNDCALAVVNELQRAAGLAIPHRAWLAHTLALGTSGVALDTLGAALRHLGWSARVTRGAADLRQNAWRPPAIALMHPGHYVLLSAITTQQVEYFDPLVGLVQQPLPAFEARWTGKGVQLSARDN